MSDHGDMVCCVVTAIMLGLLYRVAGRTPSGLAGRFVTAPRRPQPTAAGRAEATVPRLAPPPRRTAVWDTSVGAVLTGGVAAAAGYLIAVAVGVWAGYAHPQGSPGEWAGRTAAVLMVAAVVSVGAAGVSRSAMPRSAAPLGWGLVGFGVAWTELTEVDLHVLALFTLTSTTGDFMLHAVGLTMLGAGALLVLTRWAAARRRPVSLH